MRAPLKEKPILTILIASHVMGSKITQARRLADHSLCKAWINFSIIYKLEKYTWRKLMWQSQELPLFLGLNSCNKYIFYKSRQICICLPQTSVNSLCMLMTVVFQVCIQYHFYNTSFYCFVSNSANHLSVNK